MSLSENSPQVEAIGFNTLDGHHLIMVNGEMVKINRTQYFQFLFGMPIEVDEPDYDAMAEYQSALQMGYSMS